MLNQPVFSPRSLPHHCYAAHSVIRENPDIPEKKKAEDEKKKKNTEYENKTEKKEYQNTSEETYTQKEIRKSQGENMTWTKKFQREESDWCV